MGHGLLPVHGDVDGGDGILQTVGNALYTGNALQGLSGHFGGLLERGHIIAVHLQGDAAAGEHLGHAVRRAGIGDGTLHILAQLHQLPACGVAALPLRDDDIGRNIVVAPGAAHAAHIHHGHGGAGGHGRADGLDIVDGQGPAGHLVGKLGGLIMVAALGHGDGGADGVQVDFGHEHEAPVNGQSCRAYQQHHRRPQHRSLVAQGPGHGLAVAGIDLIQQARLHGLLLLQHTRRHSRNQGQGNQKAGQEGEGHGQGQVCEELLGNALHEHDGQKHAHGGQGGGGDGPQHLARSGHRRLAHIGTLRAEPINILNDHHGVIHQHTHRHGQARQGDHVDGDTAEIHEDHGENDADGDGDQGDDRGAQVTQEQIQDQNGKQGAPGQAGKDGADDDANIIPLVHKGGEVQAVVLLRQLVEAVGDVFGHLRRGIVGLLIKGDGDAVFAVELGIDLIAVIGDEYLRHILQADGVYPLQAQVQQH